jgi:membrane associated rhomboid family serine protease
MEANTVLAAIRRSFIFVQLIWIGFIATIIFEKLGIDLRELGMIPRSIEGLIGIFTMHFLHGNFAHITLNTIALFMVLVPLFIFFDEEHHMLEAIFKICIVGGILIWLFGRPAIHIGSSLLFYGLTTYMVFGSIVHHKKSLLLYSLIMISLNSMTLISGLIPTDSLVSWEGHLCGAVAGFLVAIGEKKEHDRQECC